MNILRALFLTGLMLWANFGSSQSVKSSYDKDYNLSRLKTYDYKVVERDIRSPAGNRYADGSTDQGCSVRRAACQRLSSGIERRA